MENLAHQRKSLDPRFSTRYEGRNPALEPLVPTGIRTALDVGCGHGGMAEQLSKRNISVDGISWNAEELSSAQEVCRRVICCDLNLGAAELTTESYDLIICSHVLEHIAYPQNLLRDLYRALRPTGHLLVAIPNVLFWPDRLKLLLGKWQYKESGTFDYTHLRWYTIESMVDLLTEYGFSMEKVYADGWAPLPGLRFIVGDRWRASINKAFCRWRPSLFGQQLIFRCVKRISKTSHIDIVQTMESKT